MTQVKEMNNPELNWALAVQLGCQVEEHSGTVFYFTILPNGNRLYHKLPDYAGDPAASLEVQTAAMKANPALYCDNLDRVVNPKFCEGKGEYWHETEVFGLIDVRPRERAEAAYLTLKGQ